MPNSAEGESSQVPSKAPPVAAPQDVNVLMFGLLKQMTNLVGILTTQLKPNEAAPWVQPVSRLPIKISPPKAFEGGPRLRARCDLVAGGGEFLPGNGRGRTSIGANGGGVVKRGCVDLVGGVHQGSRNCRKWDVLDGIQDSCHEPQSMRTFVREWRGWILGKHILLELMWGSSKGL